MKKKLSLEDRVRIIINKADPVGLIGMSARKDEYDPEIDMIISELREVKDVRQLHNAIYNIFFEKFNEDIAGPKSYYRKLSEEIYPLKS